MHSKMIINTIASVVVLLIFVISSITVFAFVGGIIAPDVDNTVEAAPVLLEPASEPLVVEPVLNVTSHSYAEGGGCSYHSAKMQQVHAPVEEDISDQLLSQVSQ